MVTLDFATRSTKVISKGREGILSFDFVRGAIEDEASGVVSFLVVPTMSRQ
jgi:hypothetical protein